jgi:hypothetical protein
MLTDLMPISEPKTPVTALKTPGTASGKQNKWAKLGGNFQYAPLLEIAEL